MTMSDLIKREDVLELLNSRVKSSKGIYGDLGGAVSGVRELIKVMPSAEPERKNGEWIKEDLSGYLTPGGNSIYHCSECGHTEGPWPHSRLTNFCPSCGADMRGEDGKA